LEIDNVVVSAIKKACDSDETIIRFFNPSSEVKTVNISGTEVTLNEDEIGAFNGKIQPNKIVSVKI